MFFRYLSLAHSSFKSFNYRTTGNEIDVHRFLQPFTISLVSLCGYDRYLPLLFYLYLLSLAFFVAAFIAAQYSSSALIISSGLFA